MLKKLHFSLGMASLIREGELKKKNIFKVEQVERGLKQAEVDGRRKAEEVQTVKNKVGRAHLFVRV